jgi:hypothetical protein
VREETSKVSGLSKKRPKDFAWLLLVLMIAGFLSKGSIHVMGAGEASSSVAEADAAVRQAFNATLNAERAGANVSALIFRLNEAGGILGEAEIALENGNSTEAASKADECIGIAQSVRSDADVLTTSALNEAKAVFQASLVFSLAGVAVFVVVLVVVWSWFKRGHVRKTLGMKPEVAHDVEA